MAMNATRLCPLMLLPPALAAATLAIVQIFTRRRKRRNILNRDILY